MARCGIDGHTAATRDRHRALVSLTEEIEAIDWYDQRIDATGDEELRAILQHNRDEEKEHAGAALGAGLAGGGGEDGDYPGTVAEGIRLLR